MSNKKLAKEGHEPIIKKIEKRKVYSPFIDNIWGTNLADMELVSKINIEIRFLLCVIDIFNKYVWVIPLKNKKARQLLILFKKC